MQTLLKTVAKMQQDLSQLIARVKYIETHLEYRPCGPGAMKAKTDFETKFENRDSR